MQGAARDGAATGGSGAGRRHLAQQAIAAIQLSLGSGAELQAKGQLGDGARVQRGGGGARPRALAVFNHIPNTR